jgi:hypothetical protein
LDLYGVSRPLPAQNLAVIAAGKQRRFETMFCSGRETLETFRAEAPTVELDGRPSLLLRLTLLTPADVSPIDF